MWNFDWNDGTVRLSAHRSGALHVEKFLVMPVLLLEQEKHFVEITTCNA